MLGTGAQGDHQRETQKQTLRGVSEVFPKLQLKLIEDFRNASVPSLPTEVDPTANAADDGDSSREQITTAPEDMHLNDPLQIFFSLEWIDFADLQFKFDILPREGDNVAKYSFPVTLDAGQDGIITKVSALPRTTDSGYA